MKIDYAWSGVFALTWSRLPNVGQLGEHVFFTHGYSGHGVTTTHLVGRLLAEASDGRRDRFNAFASLPCPPFWGGQRFRVPLSVAGSWYYRFRDWAGV